jgi:hypothetical protein
MTNPSVLKILKGILHTKGETNIVMKRWEFLNLKRTADR